MASGRHSSSSPEPEADALRHVYAEVMGEGDSAADGEFAGWLLKRAPKLEDVDKVQSASRKMKRAAKAFFSIFGSDFARRFFVLDGMELRYYRDDRRAEFAGVVDLSTVTDVLQLEPGTAPLPGAISLVTDARVFTIAPEPAQLERGKEWYQRLSLKVEQSKRRGLLAKSLRASAATSASGGGGSSSAGVASSATGRTSYSTAGGGADAGSVGASPRFAPHANTGGSGASSVASRDSSVSVGGRYSFTNSTGQGSAACSVRTGASLPLFLSHEACRSTAEALATGEPGPVWAGSGAALSSSLATALKLSPAIQALLAARSTSAGGTAGTGTGVAGAGAAPRSLPPRGAPVFSGDAMEAAPDTVLGSTSSIDVATLLTAEVCNARLNDIIMRQASEAATSLEGSSLSAAAHAQAASAALAGGGGSGGGGSGGSGGSGDRDVSTSHARAHSSSATLGAGMPTSAGGEVPVITKMPAALSNAAAATSLNFGDADDLAVPAALPSAAASGTARLVRRTSMVYAAIDFNARMPYAPFDAGGSLGDWRLASAVAAMSAAQSSSGGGGGGRAATAPSPARAAGGELRPPPSPPYGAVRSALGSTMAASSRSMAASSVDDSMTQSSGGAPPVGSSCAQPRAASTAIPRQVRRRRRRVVSRWEEISGNLPRWALSHTNEQRLKHTPMFVHAVGLAPGSYNYASPWDAADANAVPACSAYNASNQASTSALSALTRLLDLASDKATKGRGSKKGGASKKGSGDDDAAPLRGLDDTDDEEEEEEEEEGEEEEGGEGGGGDDSIDALLSMPTRTPVPSLSSEGTALARRRGSTAVRPVTDAEMQEAAVKRATRDISVRLHRAKTTTSDTAPTLPAATYAGARTRASSNGSGGSGEDSALPVDSASVAAAYGLLGDESAQFAALSAAEQAHVAAMRSQASAYERIGIRVLVGVPSLNVRAIIERAQMVDTSQPTLHAAASRMRLHSAASYFSSGNSEHSPTSATGNGSPGQLSSPSAASMDARRRSFRFSSVSSAGAAGSDEPTLATAAAASSMPPLARGPRAEEATVRALASLLVVGPQAPLLASAPDAFVSAHEVGPALVSAGLPHLTTQSTLSGQAGAAGSKGVGTATAKNDHAHALLKAGAADAASDAVHAAGAWYHPKSYTAAAKPCALRDKDMSLRSTRVQSLRALQLAAVASASAAGSTSAASAARMAAALATNAGVGASAELTTSSSSGGGAPTGTEADDALRAPLMSFTAFVMDAPAPQPAHHHLTTGSTFGGGADAGTSPSASGQQLDDAGFEVSWWPPSPRAGDAAHGHAHTPSPSLWNDATSVASSASEVGRTLEAAVADVPAVRLVAQRMDMIVSAWQQHKPLDALAATATVAGGSATGGSASAAGGLATGATGGGAMWAPTPRCSISPALLSLHAHAARATPPSLAGVGAAGALLSVGDAGRVGAGVGTSAGAGDATDLTNRVSRFLMLASTSAHARASLVLGSKINELRAAVCAELPQVNWSRGSQFGVPAAHLLNGFEDARWTLGAPTELRAAPDSGTSLLSLGVDKSNGVLLPPALEPFGDGSVSADDADLYETLLAHCKLHIAPPGVVLYRAEPPYVANSSDAGVVSSRALLGDARSIYIVLHGRVRFNFLPPPAAATPALADAAGVANVGVRAWRALRLAILSQAAFRRMAASSAPLLGPASLLPASSGGGGGSGNSSAPPPTPPPPTSSAHRQSVSFDVAARALQSEADAAAASSAAAAAASASYGSTQGTAASAQGTAGVRVEINALAAPIVLGVAAALHDCPHTAATTVAEPSVLLELRPLALAQLTRRFPAALASLYSLASLTSPFQFVAAIPCLLTVFSDNSRRSLLGAEAPQLAHAFAACARPVFLRIGERLFDRGDAADCAYVVAHGELAVSVESSKTRGHSLLALLRRGACVGESALVLPGTRAYRATALTACTLLRITHASLRAVMGNRQRVWRSIRNAVICRDPLQLVRLPVLSHLVGGEPQAAALEPLKDLFQAHVLCATPRDAVPAPFDDVHRAVSAWGNDLQHTTASALCGHAATGLFCVAAGNADVLPHHMAQHDARVPSGSLLPVAREAALSRFPAQRLVVGDWLGGSTLFQAQHTAEVSAILPCSASERAPIAQAKTPDAGALSSASHAVLLHLTRDVLLAWISTLPDCTARFAAWQATAGSLLLKESSRRLL